LLSFLTFVQPACFVRVILG